MQVTVIETQRFERLYRREHIVAVLAGLAMSLPHQMKLLRKVESAGILNMSAVDHVNERADPPLRRGQQRDRAQRLAIDTGHLFAAAQISDHRGALPRRDPVRDPAAGAAEIEPEHKSRPLGRAAMDVAEHAERTVRADQPRRLALHEIEAGPPDQRAIAENPEVFVEMFDGQLHEDSGA